MNQNLVSLTVSDQDVTEIRAALETLEKKLSGLIDLSPQDRRNLTKMGGKSEAFCRETINILAQNPQLAPPSFNLPEVLNDLGSLDKLRPLFARLHMLAERADDTELALGSDLMNSALEGYVLLKLVKKGEALDALRAGISTRFARSRRSEAPVAAAAP